MTDKKPQEFTVEFSLPDVITIGVWDTYMAGKQAYRTQQEKAEKPVTESIAEYWGALALIEAGLVHIKNAPEGLTHWLTAKDRAGTPVVIVWYVCREVAVRVEGAFFGTLPWANPVTSPNGSSNTTTT
jgi:hypothetical protein